MEVLVALFSFVAGALIDRIALNREWDRTSCETIKGQIDKVVGHFHERFSSSQDRRQNASTLFDYEIMSLVDDTSLIPVIGSKAFDGEYIRLISKIYRSSQVDPATATPEERSAVLEAVDRDAVDLKKVISSNQRQMRILSRT